MSTGSISGLRERIDAVVVAPATDDLVEGLAALADLRAKVLEGLVEFVRSGGNDADGWRSVVGWLQAHMPMTRAEACRWAAQARSLAAWPTLAGLLFDRALSGAQVDVVCRAIPKDLAALYAEHDAEISPLLVGLCVSDTSTAIHDWVAKAQAVTSPDPSEAIDPGAPVEVGGYLRISSYGADGGAAVVGDLDADTAALVLRAFAIAERPDRGGEDRMGSQRNAESWRTICQFFLDHHTERANSRARNHPHLHVVTDIADLYRAMLWGLGVHTAADLERLLHVRHTSMLEEALMRDALAHATGRLATPDGDLLSPAALTTIFGAGSTMARVLMADGVVVDHGRHVRLFTGPARDAMLIRDRGCRFPTPTGEPCQAPVDWIDGHHVTHWDRGGTTDPDNALALCASHHGYAHRDGWTCEVEPDGAVTVTRPDGATLTGPPRSTRPPQLPLHHPTIAALRPQLPPLPEAPTDEPSPSPSPGMLVISTRAAQVAARVFQNRGKRGLADEWDLDDPDGIPRRPDLIVTDPDGEQVAITILRRRDPRISRAA
jgi:hypothetical protein